LTQFLVSHCYRCGTPFARVSNVTLYFDLAYVRVSRVLDRLLFFNSVSAAFTTKNGYIHLRKHITKDLSAHRDTEDKTRHEMDAG